MDGDRVTEINLHAAAKVARDRAAKFRDDIANEPGAVAWAVEWRQQQADENEALADLLEAVDPLGYAMGGSRAETLAITAVWYKANALADSITARTVTG